MTLGIFSELRSKPSHFPKGQKMLFALIPLGDGENGLSSPLSPPHWRRLQDPLIPSRVRNVVIVVNQRKGVGL